MCRRATEPCSLSDTQTAACRQLRPCHVVELSEKSQACTVAGFNTEYIWNFSTMSGMVINSPDIRSGCFYCTGDYLHQCKYSAFSFQKQRSLRSALLFASYPLLSIDRVFCHRHHRTLTASFHHLLVRKLLEKERHKMLVKLSRSGSFPRKHE